MNVELLNTVRERILANAARFNMKYYGVRLTENIDEVLETPVCKTQACVAGETLLATGLAQINPELGGFVYSPAARERDTDAEELAREALGLTFGQAQKLFMFKSWGGLTRDGWPENFEEEYREATTASARAEVASRRILHFIATNGEE